MSPHVEYGFFCKRCRAREAKRCRCPLPAIGTNHDWDADAAYNLWPDLVAVPASAPTGRDGSAINLRELLDHSRT